MNKPKNIIVHHSAVSRMKNNEQFNAIDNYHKRKGWGMIGYQYLIEPDGTIKKGREENQAGAHTYQKMMNYRSIGICLTGNFDLEEPTLPQIKSLHSLIVQLKNKYKIKDSNVYPHRHFAKYKTCWGSKLPDDIIGFCKNSITKSEEVLELEEWEKEAIVFASKYISDMPLLLSGNPYSMITLIKRALDDNK